MPRKQIGVGMGRGNKPKARVTVKIGGKWRQRTKTFDVGTAPKDIAAWRAEQQGKHAGRPKSKYGTLGAMVEAYLPSIAHRPSYPQVALCLDQWCAALGRDRRADSITHLDIDAVLDRWATTPVNPPDEDGKRRASRPSAETGLLPSTLQLRRAFLRRLFFAVNGPDGFNPVRASRCPGGNEVSEADEGRGLPVADALAIIAAMPDRVWVSKGISQPSLLKRRARVFLWTGFHPKILGQIKRTDLALDAKPKPYVYAPRRKKGAGVERRKTDLLPGAVDAFRDLIAVDGLGPFEAEYLNEAVKRGARRAGVQLPPNFHAYDLRHTFGSILAESGSDEGTIGRLMLHAANSRIARRYTKAAHAKVNAAAIDRAAAFIAQAVAAAAEVATKPVAVDTTPKTAPAPVRAQHRARAPKVRQRQDFQRVG